MIKFSIIIPLYNKERSIRTALESVLGQHYTNFEVIVVNDGSTDNSLKNAESIVDPRIRLLNKPNGGVSSARNRGIKESTGDWIAFFDADDVLYPNALEEYKFLIEQFPEAKVVSTSVDQTNKKYNSRPNRYLITDYDLAETICTAKTGFAVTNSDCICVRRDCFDHVGLFNENYTHGEDLDMWQRLSRHTPFAKTDIATALYIIGAENNSLEHVTTGKFAPIALLNRPRKEFTTSSVRLRHGCKAFHTIFPQGFIKQPGKSVKLIFRYGDWIFRYACLFARYRFFDKRS